MMQPGNREVGPLEGQTDDGGLRTGNIPGAGMTDGPSSGGQPGGYEQAGGPAQGGAGTGAREPLLSAEQRGLLSDQWTAIQAGFVDRPRESVEQADRLVVDLVERVTAGLAQERSRLEARWERGDEVSTEDLRVALTLYRSFFDRLLST